MVFGGGYAATCDGERSGEAAMVGAAAQVYARWHGTSAATQGGGTMGKGLKAWVAARGGLVAAQSNFDYEIRLVPPFVE